MKNISEAKLFNRKSCSKGMTLKEHTIALTL